MARATPLSITFLEVDEFLPLVEIKHDKVKDAAKKIYEIDGDELKESEDSVTLSEHIASDKRTFNVQQLTTDKEKLKLTFKVNKGTESNFVESIFEDDDGYIEPKLSIEDENFKIVSELKNHKKYGDEIEVEIELNAEERKEFYLDFYAKDDEDFFNNGEYENVHCGQVKIIYEIPNEWEFSATKIQLIRQYAATNNANMNGPGDANKYHHCTDTHKHIALKLLDTPAGLDLGKNQDHTAGRATPNDFTKAGESTTHGVRNGLIGATYAEPSKTFTVLDINGKEVLSSNGKPGNTDVKLSAFKESPVQYMKDNCPDDGFYLFIGAYNDDYHSFSILVKKDGANFDFDFIDQIVGAQRYTGTSLENDKLLYNIRGYKFNYPMKLELYQLRNKKK